MASWSPLSNLDRRKTPDTAIVRRDDAGAHLDDSRLYRLAPAPAFGLCILMNRAHLARNGSAGRNEVHENPN
jgi:hypothetical protein